MKRERAAGPFRLYRHYLSVLVRGRMQDKKSFFLSVTGMFLTSLGVFFSIFFMFQRFPSVKGFSYSEVLLCYSIVSMGFTMSEIFARGFDSFAGIVRRGEFDRILLRPRNTVLQVLGSRFELARIGRLLQAAVIFVYGIRHSGVRWTPGRVLTAAAMLAGTWALFTGIFMLYAAICFFTLEGLEFMNIFTYGLNEYGKYPMSVYGREILWITTYLLPFALVQYYPLLYLLDREAKAWYGFLPLAGFPFLGLCCLLWNFGAGHYMSSGS